MLTHVLLIMQNAEVTAKSIGDQTPVTAGAEQPVSSLNSLIDKEMRAMDLIGRVANPRPLKPMHRRFFRKKMPQVDTNWYPETVTNRFRSEE